MGFNLGIGEAVLEEFEGEEDRVTVAVEFSDNAPLNSSDDHSNFCYPGYITWSRFAQEVGLHPVFYEPVWTHNGVTREGVLHEHPGCIRLTEEHHAAFNTARESWLSRKPEDRLLAQGITSGEDYVLRRLDWLTFWTRWALDNCKRPSFSNS